MPSGCPLVGLDPHEHAPSRTHASRLPSSHEHAQHRLAPRDVSQRSKGAEDEMVRAGPGTCGKEAVPAVVCVNNAYSTG